MVLDRYRSSIFAVCTDDNIYEYHMESNNTLPYRCLAAHSLRSSFIRSATSPVSDHLLVGTSHNHALIWDLQESTKSKQDVMNHPKLLPYIRDKKYATQPKFKLGGHNGNVEFVSWNSSGDIIASLDEKSLRIWSRELSKADQNGEFIKEITVDNRPLKLTYPELIPTAEISIDKENFYFTPCDFHTQEKRKILTPRQKSIIHRPSN